MSEIMPVNERIQSIIDAHSVVLFMKGNAQMPQCGFSSRAVQALQAVDVDFHTVDVIRDPEIRQGIKDFSEWPTIPQLYIDREFIGGSDIIGQMLASGELHTALGKVYEPPKAPEVHLSESFVAAIRDAGRGARGIPRLQVSPRFEYGIGFSEKAPGDFEVESGGITILVDPGSAPRADGIRLDFQTGEGGGVLIDNPNEPPTVKQLSVEGLKRMIDSEAPIHLIDVRTAEERATARIDPSIHLDDEGAKALAELPEDALLVFYCHHGIRSQQAAGRALQAGHRNVYNVAGGIEAWSQRIDPSVPRY